MMSGARFVRSAEKLEAVEGMLWSGMRASLEMETMSPREEVDEVSARKASRSSSVAGRLSVSCLDREDWGGDGYP